MIANDGCPSKLVDVLDRVFQVCNGSQWARWRNESDTRSSGEALNGRKCMEWHDLLVGHEELDEGELGSRGLLRNLAHALPLNPGEIFHLL